jgi:hypothetical protein
MTDEEVWTKVAEVFEAAAQSDRPETAYGICFQIGQLRLPWEQEGRLILKAVDWAYEVSGSPWGPRRNAEGARRRAEWCRGQARRAER